MYAYIHTYTHTCIHRCVYGFILSVTDAFKPSKGIKHLCIRTRTHAHIYIYIYIHTHTCIHRCVYGTLVSVTDAFRPSKGIKHLYTHVIFVREAHTACSQQPLKTEPSCCGTLETGNVARCVYMYAYTHTYVCLCIHIRHARNSLSRRNRHVVAP